MGNFPFADRLSSPSPVPPAVRAAAAALGLAREPLAAFGGASGSTWACGDAVVRIGDGERLRREVLAMRSAAQVVPVPEVLNMAVFTDDEGRARAALLVARLPGRPVGDLEGSSSARARRVGERCGRLHATLAAVPPPPGLPAAATGAGLETHATRSLLHLDLHPLNVLVDEAGDISGVLDWANTAAGPAVLDRARTWSILALDPAVLPLWEDPRYAALLQGWARTAGFDGLPATARAWACETMLDDLAYRYPASRLDHVRRCLAENVSASI